MSVNVRSSLLDHGIRPSAHRLAVAGYVLTAHNHPSADKVWREVSSRFPAISRATVYNTLNLFVEKGLLRALHLDPESVVFDPKLDTHHHFIDEETGTIHDIPWNKVQVCNIDEITEYRIDEYMVIMRGKRR